MKKRKEKITAELVPSSGADRENQRHREIKFFNRKVFEESQRKKICFASLGVFAVRFSQKKTQITRITQSLDAEEMGSLTKLIPPLIKIEHIGTERIKGSPQSF
ncbi:hypothetical protein KIH41_17520 [Litoribacter ruber]|uniref:hypothetical protein n=1 Tax=Litoribacter ruber TaxID=702568 RepID=UPI001BDAB43F|nr:hypothetical protein [Litoribacter ruber]MBT0813092.1 hypothetical protein [Litoribacter ruber]